MALYKHAYNQAFPYSQVKPNKKYIKRESWMSAGLMTSMRHKSKLLVKKVNRPTNINIANYKNYTNMYNKLKRKMKVDHYKHLLELYKHDMKKTWSTLKSVLGKHTDKAQFPHTFIINDEQISDRSVIAQSFNDYFSSIGLKTSENVPPSSKQFADFLDQPNPNSMFLEPVESSHISEIVNKLKPKTSFGHDEISTKMIKATLNNILQPFTHIVNRSLATGIVPDQMKIAKVIPVYKSSEADKLSNYRPISLLPAFSKVLEKVMANKL